MVHLFIYDTILNSAIIDRLDRPGELNKLNRMLIDFCYFWFADKTEIHMQFAIDAKSK